jgi:beta-phosphoglucomutase
MNLSPDLSSPDLPSPDLLSPGLAFLFDMDGVMVDSNPLHRESWSVFSRRYGLETTDAMLQRMYGKRNDDIVRDFFGELPSGEVDARGKEKERLYRELLADRLEDILVPGLRHFLEIHQSTPMGIASNAEPENVDFLLDRAGLRPYFRVVVDGHQVRNPKPDPEIYLRAAELLGVAPPNCIVFEDSHSGVAAAVAAKMRVIGLRTTDVNLPGTDLTIDNFLSADLDPWLRSQRLQSQNPLE